MQEINLYRLLQYYAKKWFIIAAFTATGLAAGFAYTHYIQTPLYKSSATLILVDEKKEKTTTYDITLINNYIELMKSRKVLEPVIAELRLDTRYEDLVKSIETTSEKETEVIKISVAHEDPETSSKIADTAIMSFKREVGKLYDTDNIQVVDNANLPHEPYNVREAMQLALAGAAGFFAAILMLFFIYDFKITKHQLEAEAARRIKPIAQQPAQEPEKKPSAGRKIMRSVVSLVIGTPKRNDK